MSIPRGASLETVLDTFGSSDFVAQAAVDVECSRRTLEEAYTANVELMAQLDAYSQLVVGEMGRALGDLKKSEKRTKYQFDLLKNDVANLDAQQSQAGAEVAAAVHRGLNAESLVLLKQLEDEKSQMEAVKQLLVKAQGWVQGGEAGTDELKAVVKGTPEERA